MAKCKKLFCKQTKLDARLFEDTLIVKVCLILFNKMDVFVA